jgi:hypothetical protein
MVTRHVVRRITIVGTCHEPCPLTCPGYRGAVGGARSPCLLSTERNCAYPNPKRLLKLVADWFVLRTSHERSHRQQNFARRPTPTKMEPRQISNGWRTTGQGRKGDLLHLNQRRPEIFSLDPLDSEIQSFGMVPVRTLNQLAKRAIQAVTCPARRSLEGRFFFWRRWLVLVGMSAMAGAGRRRIGIRISDLTMAMQERVRKIHRFPTQEQQGGQDNR